MIIRIDVQDNDFAEDVLEVLSRKVYGLYSIYDSYFSNELDKYSQNDDEESLKKYKDISIERDAIREMIFDGNVPKDKEKNVKDILKKSIIYLLGSKFNGSDLEYLNDTIEISFPKSMKAEWENAEVIYYIPNTYSENKFMLF